MHHTSPTTPLDLSRWRNVPLILTIAGGALSLLGLAVNAKEFAYTWLLAFMFFLSLALGGLFLVMVHHLFDASWSVPIRRICEHLANLLFPTMAILFIPIALMAKTIFPWMNISPQVDHALAAKQPMFTVPAFYIMAVAFFAIWWLLAGQLRYWSLQQDRTGAALPTYRMRVYSGFGIFLFAITLTLAVVMWMKSLQWQWFSTMYGVYYFAGSAWMALATVYVITMVLDRMGILTSVIHSEVYYFIGSLLFAFTVFYAYIHFAQYFIIWNGNIPEETFWYLVREKGTWWWVGMIIIFGHFFVPFLALLRIDVKSIFPYMLPLCAWAWLMHWFDLSFNIMPVPHPNGFPLQWIWLHVGCWAFMAGIVSMVFLRSLAKHPPYPLKDPRLMEALGLHLHSGRTSVAQSNPDLDAPPQFGGTNR